MSIKLSIFKSIIMNEIIIRKLFIQILIMLPLVRFIRALFEALKKLRSCVSLSNMRIRSLGYGPIRYLFFQTRGATQHTNGGCILKVETHSRIHPDCFAAAR